MTKADKAVVSIRGREGMYGQLLKLVRGDRASGKGAKGAQTGGALGVNLHF